MTRSRGFAHLSGVGEHPFYDEVRRVMASGSSFRRPKRELVD